MDLRNVDVQSVQYGRPQRVNPSELPTQPAHAHIKDRPSSISSASDAPTVIRWVTPPSRKASPQPSIETIKPYTQRHSIGANDAAHSSNTPLVVRFDEEQIRNTEARVAKKEEKMEQSMPESGPPTPVDDTPYIRFAIEQLTRDEEVNASQRPSTSMSQDSYPVDRIVPDYGLGYLSTHPRQREELALTRKHRSTPITGGKLFNYNATRPLSEYSTPSPVLPRQILSASPEIFIPVEPPTHTPRYPKLTFVPAILRPTSMAVLSALCLLMIIAIMFCAIYSTYHNGLLGWSGGVYGGRYLLFGFLPQIFAACIFVYVQGVMSATTRILPFTMMASENAYIRSDALCLGIVPRTMLWPNWNGPISIKISNLLFWLTVFTIPLQSCLFSVALVDGVWRWSTVQGVAWTLIAVYIFALIAAVIQGLFFFRRTTGLMWDPRSLADIVTLLPRSNCLASYSGTDVMARKEELRGVVALRNDRLGYWMTQHRNQGLFYCVGEEGTATRRYTIQYRKIAEKQFPQPDIEKNSGLYTIETRYRYLPWVLRDTYVVFWAIAGFLTLPVLIIISFLPSTALRNGFVPLVPAKANIAGFSSANFLYSFIPSVLGMLLFLFLQSIDMSLRKLQPYADLGRTEGSTAQTSLLADYTASLPVQCTLNALSNRHYRVAFVSLLSSVAILLPVLGGGLFFPLTAPSLQVRMFPNIPAFCICLIILIFYVTTLIALLPKRTLMRLPHDVDCLAEIFSFVHATRMLDDAAFRAPRSKPDLVTRLIVIQHGGKQAMYGFGLYVGRYGKVCLGIDRMDRPRSIRLSIMSPK